MRQVTVKWYETTYSAPIEGEEYEDDGELTDSGEEVRDDEYSDPDDGESIVTEVAKYLSNEGATEPSSAPYTKGTWYTARDKDNSTGESIETNYHLQEGALTEDEEREVYRLVTGR